MAGVLQAMSTSGNSVNGSGENLHSIERFSLADHESDSLSPHDRRSGLVCPALDNRNGEGAKAGRQERDL
jgi:hypothetical protein